MTSDRILNLTGTVSTPEQRAQGVVDPCEEMRAECARLLAFRFAPDGAEIRIAAEGIRTMAVSMGADRALIGGAPFMVPYLQFLLRESNIEVMFAFGGSDFVAAA